MSSAAMEESRSKRRRSMATEEEEEKFTIEETKFLTSVYLIVSEEETILDSSHGVFWFCLGVRFREMKPAWVPDRDYDQLRNHWARVQKDISKFVAIVADYEKMWGRRHGEDYAHYQAEKVFFSSQRRKFEYMDVWEMFRIHNKYCSERTKVEFSPGAAIDESRSKRCRSVATEEEGESFTIEETNVLACAYIFESKDAVLDGSSEVFWFCVAKTFKEMKAAWVPDRDPNQLRKHWDRVRKDVSKFDAIFASCQKMYSAKEAFFRNEGRMFEYEDVWEVLCSGSEEASSGLKRTNVEDSMGDTSSPSMGTKAAKRKGKAKASIAPISDPQLAEYSKIAEAMLIKEYSKMLARDTYMSKENRKFHQELLDFVRSKVIRK